MTKIIYAVAALATLGFAATAEAKQDPAERAAWNQTIRNEHLAPVAAPVFEGRNATVVSPTVPNDYIDRSVQQDNRSTK